MELKNCPFCDSPAHDDGDNGYHRLIRCSKLFTREDSDGTTCSQAYFLIPVEEWNTRPTEDALRAKLEAAEAYIKARDELEEAKKHYGDAYGNNIIAHNLTVPFYQKMEETRKEWEEKNGISPNTGVRDGYYD